jgi:hypothetical protein
MRAKLFFTAIVISFPIHAAEPLPPKTLKLKESYDTAIQRATDPITKVYLAELTRHKVEATRAADLKGAIAIDAEITRVSSRTQGSQALTELLREGGVFVYRVPAIGWKNEWKFSKDGVVTKDSKQQSSTWKISGAILRVESSASWNEFEIAPTSSKDDPALREINSSAGHQEGASLTKK